VKGFVEVTVRVSRIKDVNPLGGSMIALPSLRPDCFATQSNLVRPYFLSL
jgi:hypothetical protein